MDENAMEIEVRLLELGTIIKSLFFPDNQSE